MIKKLNSMPYAQAHVKIYDNGAIRLVSYSTPVIDIDKNGIMYVHGLYSATTRKHISAFMKEYTNYDYYLAKRLYEKKQVYKVW